MRKVYAGKAEELAAERLRALAATLADGPAPAATPVGGPDPVGAAGVRLHLFGPARLERDGRPTASLVRIRHPGGAADFPARWRYRGGPRQRRICLRDHL